MAASKGGRAAAPVTVMTDADLRRQIKEGELSGAYLLFGQEDYLKNHALSQIRAAVIQESAFAVFNEVTLDPTEFSPGALENALMTFPMGQDKKLVAIKGLSLVGMRAAALDGFIDAVSLVGELTHNILVITVPPDGLDAGRLPSRPSAQLKRLGACMSLVSFELQTPSRLSLWAAKHFQHLGVAASGELCLRLIDRCGRSMYTLSSEIEKLSYYILSRGRNVLTAADLEEVSVAALDCDAFDLTNAVISGDRERAMAVLEVLRFRRVEPVIILGEISSTLVLMTRVAACLENTSDLRAIAASTGIHEYRVSIMAKAIAAIKSGTDRERLDRAVLLCADADRKLKSAAQGYAPIEIMLCSI